MSAWVNALKIKDSQQSDGGNSLSEAIMLDSMREAMDSLSSQVSEANSSGTIKVTSLFAMPPQEEGNNITTDNFIRELETAQSEEEINNLIDEYSAKTYQAEQNAIRKKDKKLLEEIIALNTLLKSAQQNLVNLKNADMAKLLPAQQIASQLSAVIKESLPVIKQLAVEAAAIKIRQNVEQQITKNAQIPQQVEISPAKLQQQIAVSEINIRQNYDKPISQPQTANIAIVETARSAANNNIQAQAYIQTNQAAIQSSLAQNQAIQATISQSAISCAAVANQAVMSQITIPPEQSYKPISTADNLAKVHEHGAGCPCCSGVKEESYKAMSSTDNLSKGHECSEGCSCCAPKSAEPKDMSQTHGAGCPCCSMDNVKASSVLAVSQSIRI